MTSSHITSWWIDGEKVETVADSIFLGSRTTVDSDCLHKIKRCLFLGRQAMTNLCIKKQRHHFADRSPYIQSYGFSSSHVQMWELDHKEVWVLNWCFQTVVLEKTFESPLVDKEIKPVNPKGNQPWIFIGRTEAEFETDILATWWEELTHWKRHWCWERLRAGGKGGDRGWDGWMASLTQWTFEQTGRQWRTGKPGMLQSMGSQIWTWLRDWTILWVVDLELVQISIGEGNGNPLQYSCLDKGAWWATIHGVTKSHTWLSNWVLSTNIYDRSTKGSW